MDAMGVIFKVGDDTNDLLVPYVQSLNPSMIREAIVETYLEASLGMISSEVFWFRVGLGKQFPRVEHDYLEEHLVLDQGAIALARDLARDYGLVILSNDVSEWSAYLRKKFRLMELFELAVISGDVGLRKPDRKIFEKTLELIKASARDVALLDDSSKNLQAASSCGINALLVRADKVVCSVSYPDDTASLADAAPLVRSILGSLQ
jgi:putative hydrolase of the HAD superfamily